MEAALAKLDSLIPKDAERIVQGIHSRQFVSEQMNVYLKRLGIDVTKLSVVHVAGTKGKGSTCAFVDAILREHGFKTGLYTSPHLIRPNERFCINGAPISDKLFVDAFWHCWRTFENWGSKTSCRRPDCKSADKCLSTVEESLPLMPGFFRFLTLMSFHLFVEQGCDVIVLEVGLGGRLDATNVVPRPVVCGITSIGLDHVEVLGDTVEKIAGEKAGIIKPGVPAFSARQQKDSIFKVFQNAASEIGTTISYAPDILRGKDGRLPILGIAGHHQYQNAALAVQLAHTWLAAKDKSLVPEVPFSFPVLVSFFLSICYGALCCELLPTGEEEADKHLFFDSIVILICLVSFSHKEWQVNTDCVKSC